MANFWSFFTGSPEKHKRVSTLTKQQQPLADQLVNAGLSPGAGGAFGTAADYYRNLMSDNPADFDSFAAPEQRRFNEQIIPDLAEQFAGMGSGALSSSGFRNAAVNAGTDLSERLGAIRANLRQAGAQGLSNIGQAGLQNFSQDVMTQPGTQGVLSPALGALGTAFLGPAGGAVGSLAGNWLSNSIKGSTSPYGGNLSSAYDQNFRRTGVF
jgi:hypothetical protein